jgi:hypothetical protein
VAQTQTATPAVTKMPGRELRPSHPRSLKTKSMQ